MLRRERRDSVRKIAMLVFFCFVCVVLFNEYFVYYFVIWKCRWPSGGADNNKSTQLKALVLADPHLLGERNGFWIDKLRREWQMQRSFQTALQLHKPDIVFILGDLFDEGQWADKEQWKLYVTNSRRIFSTPGEIPVHTVVGNHDVGFHYDITKTKLSRFLETFQRGDNVRLFTVKDTNFVMINTMGFNNDDCFMCSATREQLLKVAQTLKCAGAITGDEVECKGLASNASNSRPVLLQHFPMYRESEKLCHEIDSTPKDQITIHSENYDVLAKKPSEEILGLLQPRLVLSGHVHDACYRVHENGVPEITVASFSWRNRKNPSFYLMTFTRDDFHFSKCFLPKETYVILSHVLGAATLLFNFALLRTRHYHHLSWHYFPVEFLAILVLMMGVHYTEY